MKVLILGGSGFIGNAIGKYLSSNKSFEIISTYYKNNHFEKNIQKFKLDIKNFSRITEILNKYNFDYIISSLRGNFEDQLNFHKKLLSIIANKKTKLIFLSTANVFDSDMNKAHFESDETNSHTEYGLYKIKCENLILNTDKKHSIIRLPMVWGKYCPRTKQFINDIKENKKITVYPNLKFNTITDKNLAEKIKFIISNNLNGVFNFGSYDQITHKEFYIQILENLNFDYSNFIENYEYSGYFTLLSERNKEFPNNLIISNQKVIKYVTENIMKYTKE